MRRATTGLIAALLLLVAAGCSAGSAQLPVRDPSKFVVLGSANATQGVVTTPMPGLSANSIPQDAIKGVPGASDVVVASGTPSISRERAIQMTQPKTGKLVSAVDVVLPQRFVAAVINNPKKAKPTTAWIVTWSGVTLYPTGSAGSKPRIILDGIQATVIDATTGEQLLETQYSGKP